MFLEWVCAALRVINCLGNTLPRSSSSADYPTYCVLMLHFTDGHRLYNFIGQDKKNALNKQIVERKVVFGTVRVLPAR